VWRAIGEEVECERVPFLVEGVALFERRPGRWEKLSEHSVAAPGVPHATLRS